MSNGEDFSFLDKREEETSPIPWKSIFLFFVRKVDLLQVIPMLLLFSIGLAFIYGTGQQTGASTSILWKRQLQYFGIGCCIWLLLSVLDYRWLGLASLAVYPVSAGLLLWVLLDGVKYYGATRWLVMGGVSIQPSEAAKVAVVFTIAWLLSLKQADINKPLWMLAVVLLAGIPFFLIYKEPDLGTGLVMLAAVGAIVFCAGLKWRYILILVIVMPLLAGGGLLAMKSYQRDRIMVFLHPEQDPLNKGWSQLQAEIAVGSGGITGKGFMEGTHNALGYLPQTVSNSDFIFPVIAEEKGVIGSLFVIALFMLLIFSILRTALLSQDRFGRYLCAGAGVILFMHSAVNIGMCIRLAPVTGVPLPLVSYGGTFLVAVMTYLGLVHSVYIHNDKKSVLDL